ncbi:hypothetical protein N8H74_05600 [Pseudomonas sp. B2M1-30]|uniref:hypothetical protein n=1 Tax=Pseudomonas TaxID=286 RepID=UPI0021CA7E52|nr:MULTISPECIES: hypothetical protein [Pseudomonas]MCU0117719.1 hypothetical protein [Pseudomonas sp. B2M1-30]MCU7259255.1 hypothetical protein [Pseudomonas koreensis]
MAIINLVIDLPPSFQDKFVATWDIINANMEICARGAFFSESTASLRWQLPGRYWARVHLPNGESQSRAFELTGNDEPVEVRFPQNMVVQHEWLGWASIGESSELVQQGFNGPVMDDLWTRAWTYSQEQWSPSLEAVDAVVNHDTGLYQLELDSSCQDPLMLEIGGPDIATRFVVIPQQGFSRLLIITKPATNLSEPADDRIEVAVSLRNSVADNLIRFLTASQSGTDQVSDQDLLEKCKELLNQKAQDPLAAIVGGYFILQHRRDVPIEWLNRLALLTPWMADGYIQYANALLLVEGIRNVPMAVQALIQASSRGYPLFRRGMRLFLDTLRILESVKAVEQNHRLMKQAELYAQVLAADTRQSAFTSFYGTSPNSPVKPTSPPDAVKTQLSSGIAEIFGLGKILFGDSLRKK